MYASRVGDGREGREGEPFAFNFYLLKTSHSLLIPFPLRCFSFSEVNFSFSCVTKTNRTHFVSWTVVPCLVVERRYFEVLLCGTRQGWAFLRWAHLFPALVMLVTTSSSQHWVAAPENVIFSLNSSFLCLAAVFCNNTHALFFTTETSVNKTDNCC